MSDDRRSTWSRRRAIGGLVAGALGAAPARLLAECLATPGAELDGAAAGAWGGPFWRQGAPFSANFRGEREDGKILVVSGRLLDADGCRPLAGAVIDIWACDPDGVYHNDETSVAAGRFRGRLRTDGDGFYEYETLAPVPYRVDGSSTPRAHPLPRERRGTRELPDADVLRRRSLPRARSSGPGARAAGAPTHGARRGKPRPRARVTRRLLHDALRRHASPARGIADRRRKRRSGRRRATRWSTASASVVWRRRNTAGCAAATL